MEFKRIISRIFPDGVIRQLQPFHISLEGLETNIICRDDEDCDVMVKQICICGRRRNVVIVMYGVVGTHAHAVVLAESYEIAKAFAIEIKRVYSIYFQKKYSNEKVLARTHEDVREIDSDWYLRNAIAYDIANALDTGSRIEEYKWTGYRSMFSRTPDKVTSKCFPVSELSCRQVMAIFHSRECLKSSKWMLDENLSLLPATICYHKYAEEAFNNDSSYFIQTIGNLKKTEMKQRLSGKWLCDSDFIPIANEVSNRWFKKDVDSLSVLQKQRIIPFIYRGNRTSIAQMARVFHLTKDDISEILGLKRSEVLQV